MLALAALKGYNVNQADVSTAFLHADVDEELYMEQPEGYRIQGEQGQPLVCKLKKSLYGLKQAGRNWNKTLDSWLKENNFTVSKADPCLYTLTVNGKFIAIAIYVDDIISLDNDPELRRAIIGKLSKRFKVTDIGETKWILGTKVERKDGTIKLHQEKYVNDILQRYQMLDCKPAVTPIVPGQKDEEKKPFEDINLYRSVVGSLIYLSVVSRPDIAYAVGKVGQKMSNPTQADWMAAKRILRYVRKDTGLGPTYSKDSSKEVTGYADSDWGGDLEARRSTSGYVFTLGGAAISWSSKRQQTVALSSTEAEYMALCSATQEAIYLKALLKDLKHEQNMIKIHQDNQGSMMMARNAVVSRRSKHIDIKYHFTREKLASKEIELKYIPTDEMVADCLTKAVSANAIGRAKMILYGPQISE
jgi:hypothetical protein